MDLFTVQGHHWQEGCIGLLPGVPNELLGNPAVKHLTQGSAIELCLPCGRVICTHIGAYYMRIPTSPGLRSTGAVPSIVIALPREFGPDDVPIGTIVRLGSSTAA